MLNYKLSSHGNMFCHVCCENLPGTICPEESPLLLFGTNVFLPYPVIHFAHHCHTIEHVELHTTLSGNIFYHVCCDTLPGTIGPEGESLVALGNLAVDSEHAHSVMLLVSWAMSSLSRLSCCREGLIHTLLLFRKSDSTDKILAWVQNCKWPLRHTRWH